MSKPAGYSTKSLAEKLGYQPGDRVYALHAPEWFVAYSGRAGFEVVDALPADWAQLFVTTRAELERDLRGLDLDGIGKALWLSWPKRSGGLATDLTENRLREAGLALGWVDIKVCAVDETWSGLKFTRRAVREF